MIANLKSFAKRFTIDAVMGLLASLFLKLVIGMLPGLMGAILPPLIYNAEQWKNIVNILGYWQIFAVIFGLRFVIAYITGTYAYNPEQAALENVLKKLS